MERGRGSSLPPPVGGLLAAVRVVLIVRGATDCVECRLFRKAQELSVVQDSEGESGVFGSKEVLRVSGHPLVDDGHTPIAIVTQFLVARRVPDQSLDHSPQLLFLCLRER